MQCCIMAVGTLVLRAAVGFLRYRKKGECLGLHCYTMGIYQHKESRVLSSGIERRVDHGKSTDVPEKYVASIFPAHPASYPMGTEGSSLGLKGPGREADHSPPSSAEVKKSGALPPLPIYLHGIVIN
jgi:hypothetical protein